MVGSETDELLKLKDLSVTFFSESAITPAVERVSLEIEKGSGVWARWREWFRKDGDSAFDHETRSPSREDGQRKHTF